MLTILTPSRFFRPPLEHNRFDYRTILEAGDQLQRKVPTLLFKALITRIHQNVLHL